LLRKKIEASLSHSNGIILTHEIDTLLFTAKSDEELDLVVKAIQRYETQHGELGLVKFNFGAPLMRLFYVRSKTDKALELFMSNVIATHLIS
jgi:hypothetical protein